MTTKEALSHNLINAASHTNRVRALLALSKEVPAEVFQRLAGQHPLTMPRDLGWAEEGFKRAKHDYEEHCREINAPAYATYDED